MPRPEMPLPEQSEADELKQHSPAGSAINNCGRRGVFVCSNERVKPDYNSCDDYQVNEKTHFCVRRCGVTKS
jgi:hypothetical protein